MGVSNGDTRLQIYEKSYSQCSQFVRTGPDKRKAHGGKRKGLGHETAKYAKYAKGESGAGGGPEAADNSFNFIFMQIL